MLVRHPPKFGRHVWIPRSDIELLGRILIEVVQLRGPFRGRRSTELGARRRDQKVRFERAVPDRRQT
jgi:hypothetical protein